MTSDTALTVVPTSGTEVSESLVKNCCWMSSATPDTVSPWNVPLQFFSADLGADLARQLVPADRQVGGADLVVVLDVGAPSRVVGENGDGSTHRREVRARPRRVVRGRSPGLTAVPCGSNRDLALDVVDAGVDFGREPDETRRGRRSARGVQVPGTPARVRPGSRENRRSFGGAWFPGTAPVS